MLYINKDAESISASVPEQEKAETINWADELAEGFYTHRARLEMERCTLRIKSDDSCWNILPQGISDPEWIFALARLSSLTALSGAYAYTKEDSYRITFRKILFSFINHSDRKGLSWRSLETGIRPENLIRGLETLKCSGDDVSDLEKPVNALLDEHIPILMNTHRGFHRLSNWGVMQDHGLFIASIYRGYEEGIVTALDRLAEEALLQTLPSGTHWEQSPMYQCEVLHSFLDTIVIADRNSVKVPEALRDKTHLMASSLKNLISASGNMFMTGDTDEINPSALLTLASHIFMDEKLASGVHEENCWDGVSPYGNRMPERKSAFMESDGHMILRGSGIEAHMFTGNMGSGHGHVSQLHLDISGRNRNFFIDPGRYTYTDCEKRLLYKSAAMHNIPMTSSDYTLKPIGSWSYNEIGETTRGRHASAAGYEVMEAENLSFIRDGLMIRRKVLKLTDEIITVIDEYFSSEYVKAVIPFHAHPDCTMHMEEGMIRLESHDETMYLLTDGNAEVGTSTVSLHYNEESDSGLVTVSKDVGKTGSVITVLSRKPVTMKHLETELIDAHRILGKSEAVSFTVSDGEHEWTVISRPAETVAQVDIIRSGSCEGYGRLIVKEKSAASATTLFF